MHASLAQWQAVLQAELRGKVAAPTEAWEDTLTDVVMSAISWLPRTIVLRRVLADIIGGDFSDEDLTAAEFHFWPRLAESAGRVCEPDLVLIAGTTACVVEAKVGACFSGSAAAGTHQLLREAAAVSQRWPHARLHLVALTRDFVEPADMAMLRDELRLKECSLTWRSWSDLARLLGEERQHLAAHEAALVDAVLELMTKRKVSSMFKGFEPTTYETVVDSTRLAAEEIHPEMAQLSDELREHFARADWTWRNASGSKTFGWWGSTEWTNASRWGRTGLPRVRLTSLTPDRVGREGCSDAQEVPSGVQA